MIEEDRLDAAFRALEVLTGSRTLGDEELGELFDSGLEAGDLNDLLAGLDALEDPPLRADSLPARWLQTVALSGGVGADPDHSYRPRDDDGDATWRVLGEPLVPDAHELIPGYDVLEVLGEGGMGTVYRARQRALMREVAVKRVLRSAARPERSSIISEALVGAFLQHPNILPIHDLSAGADGELCFSMPVIRGQEWMELIQGQGGKRLSLEEHLRILLNVCNAIAFAHSKGILHLDLKPQNVMVGEFGQVYVLDWGLATEFRDSEGPPRTRHASAMQGRPCGTPCYMAPEVARGSGELGPWTDVYLLGGCLHVILCQRPPHEGTGLWATLRAALRTEPPELPDELSEELRRICRAALEPEIARRTPDVGSFQAALESFLAHRESSLVAARAERRFAACAEEIRRARSTELPALYASLAEVVADFASARALWPENREARDGEATARRMFAETALRHGELELASSQAARLPEGGLRERLARAIDAARSARGRKERRTARLRGGLVGSVLLLVLGSLGAAALFLDQSRELATALHAEQEQSALAAQRLEEIHRLSDATEMQTLEALFAELLPIRRGSRPVLESWHAGFTAIVERLPLHRAKLAALRARALPYTDADRLADRQRNERHSVLSQRSEWLHAYREALARDEGLLGPDGVAFFQSQIELCEGSLAEAGDELEVRHTWRFEDEVDRWEHKVLSDFLGEASHLHDMAAEVGRYLRFVDTLDTCFADPGWAEAAARVAVHPLYAGLRLVPQDGLVPLGPDPDSGLEEFGLLLPGFLVPARGEDGRLSKETDDGPVLVLVPGGEVAIGATADPAAEHYDPWAGELEGPVVRVFLDPYLLQKHELSQGQWALLTGEEPAALPRDTVAGNDPAAHRQNPVENISWEDASAFARKAGVRLPTEAQWEHAARAGSAQPWWVGPDPARLEGSANLADRAFQAYSGLPEPLVPWADGYARHAVTGSFAPSPWGLHDMYGNVAEWVREGINHHLLPKRAGDGEILGRSLAFMLHRGGSYASGLGAARASSRQTWYRHTPSPEIGLRLARALER